jgi:hypothetical protein
MISFPLTVFSVPPTINPDEQPSNRTVGELPYWDICVEGSQKMRGLLALLDENSQIPGALVVEQNKLVGLIPRERVYEKLGRPFGVELFLKISSQQFFEMLEISTLVLPSEMLIDDAVKIALERDQNSLYEPIVLKYPNGYRTISMYRLLMAQ